MGKLTKQTVEKAVEKSKSYLEAAERLGVTRAAVKYHVVKHNINIQHFKGARGRFTPSDSIFKKDSALTTRTAIKKAVLRLGLLEEKCECGLSDSWQGKSLVLELDHKDGDRTNNELSNLRFLCPNCHSQTPTSKGKNKKLNKLRKL